MGGREAVRTPHVVARSMRSHACAGICLGISLVRTGGSRSPCLKPKKAPQKTRGTEMQNHMQMSATMVPKGTAPEEPRPQMKKLRKSAPGQGWWLGLN